MNSTPTPPANSWGAGFGGGSGPFPTVVPAGRYIAKDKMYVIENISNDGSIASNVNFSYNKFNGDVFTGTIGEDYIANGKAVLTNLPAGLMATIIRNTDSTLTLSFSGNATNHTALNNIQIRIDFLNASVSGGDTSVVAFHTDSIKIYFRDVLTVASSGANFTTIAGAIAASSAFDIVDIWAGTYTESNLSVNWPILFKGHGADNTIVQGAVIPFITSLGAPIFQTANNDTNSTVFKDLTIQNGYGIYGGAAYSPRATLAFYNCRIINNYVNTSGLQTFGAGVCGVNVRMYNCEVSGNRTDCSSNPNNVYGGGLYCENAFIENSTFYNNYCMVGAAIYISNDISGSGSTSSLTNVTITNNKGTGASMAGGIYSRNNNSIILKNVIVYGNTAATGADIYNNNTGVTVNATNSIIGVTSSALTSNTNGSSADPMLDTLANNGGTSQTCALKVGSPAINSGAIGSDIPTTDQRGFTANGIRDIGAYEFNGLTTGILESVKIENQLTVFPNPNNGLFTVSSKTSGTFTIFNQLGQSLQCFKLNGTNNYTIDISNLSNGVYYIMGYSNETVSNQKVIVTK